jgi:hypothetical protein
MIDKIQTLMGESKLSLEFGIDNPIKARKDAYMSPKPNIVYTPILFLVLS